MVTMPVSVIRLRRWAKILT